MPVINGIYLKDFTALPSAVTDANIIPIAIAGDQVAYRTTVGGIITDVRITGKLLTGLSVTGGAVVSTDSILTAFGKVQNQLNGKQGIITLTTTGSSGAATLVGSTLNIPNYLQDLSGFVTLNTVQTITASKTFTTSGSSNTLTISHSSGSGIGLNITKGGNGEGIYVNKTSGSGNAVTIIGTLNATTLVKNGGTSSQFLKADGSVDSSTYALASALGDYVTLATTQTITGAKTFNGDIIIGTFSQLRFANDAGFAIPPANFGAIDLITTSYNFAITAADSTYKMFAFNAFGLTNNTLRTYTLPDAAGTLALTSNITSAISGTTNFIPKFTSANIIGNSIIQDDGTNVSIGYTTNPSLFKLDVNGTIRVAGALTGTSATFSSDLTSTGIISVKGTAPFFRWLNSSDVRLAYIQHNATNLVYNADTGIHVFNQAATFSSSVTATTFINTSQTAFLLNNSGINNDFRMGSTSSQFRIVNANNSVGLLTIDNTGAATFSSSVTATSYITSSDKRLKNIIEKNGDIATYTLKNSEQIHYGYIAQDMEAEYPNQVHKDSEGYLSLNYIEILVKKVHDLEQKIIQLENK